MAGGILYTNIVNKFLFTLIVGLTAAVFASGSYLIYLQNKNIALFSKQVLGAKQSYIQLESDYVKLKQQTQPVGDKTATTNSTDAKSRAVETIINKYTKLAEGDISVYYKNLATNASLSVDPDKKYYMASLYKIILVLYMLDEIKNGAASLDDRVGTSSATLELAIDKIITESNNGYAQTLAEQYGWKNIENVMKQKLGIDFSFDGNLQITIRNVGKLFEEIAYSISVSDTDSHYILNLMNNQKKINKLPKYLPKNIYAHNKTGEFEDYSHDAGIFYTPKANYILIFMSKSKNPGATDELMAKMSKETYDTLNTATEKN